MATHKKTPIFIRVISNKTQVICINPTQLASFQVIEKANVKIKSKTTNEPEIIVADTIKFFFTNGTGLSYSVGIDITQEEFNYVCGTLTEFLYKNEAEFKIINEANEKAKMDEWNAISKENEASLEQK